MAGAVVCRRAFAAETPSEPLVRILKDELTREFSSLKAKADPAPYYMAYEVVEEQAQLVSATLGAIVQNSRNHSRGVDTTIRVGTPSFDNYHPYRGLPVHFTSFTALSLDDDANQIRRTLWAETDRVYRLASRRLTQLKTDQQLLAESKDKDPDFSSEQPETAARSAEPLRYDAKTWTDRVRSWSAEFKSHPKVLGSNINFSARRETKTLVNTEGTAVEGGSDLFRLEVNGIALAPDGMDLRVFDTVEASDPSHFPDSGKIEARVRKVAATLDALVNAPPAEPILCPAILSGRASAVFFHEIFGHRIEGHRQKDISEGQTFKLGQQVLPSFINVLSDPTEQSYKGFDLIGHYDFDDEGVKARPVQVVEGGILKTFLLSRSPVGEFVHSNAHGRRQPGLEPVSRQSNLIVESSKQMSASNLKAALIAEIKRQGKPYGLYFEEVSSGYTTTGRRGLQAFTVVPLVVYRVYPDGRPDELIRGADIVGTPLSSFQKILATSDHAEVFNGYCGAESGSVPVSAVSPAILVSEIEIQKKQNAQQRPPLLPPPGAEE
jgi:TldD protein